MRNMRKNEKDPYELLRSIADTLTPDTIVECLKIALDDLNLAQKKVIPIQTPISPHDLLKKNIFDKIYNNLLTAYEK